VNSIGWRLASKTPRAVDKAHAHRQDRSTLRPVGGMSAPLVLALTRWAPRASGVGTSVTPVTLAARPGCKRHDSALAQRGRPPQKSCYRRARRSASTQKYVVTPRTAPKMRTRSSSDIEFAGGLPSPTVRSTTEVPYAAAPPSKPTRSANGILQYTYSRALSPGDGAPTQTISA